ncbi:MAG: low molecular weight protein arginine phosphatase [Kiritimatiellaeota bacterium]|nr:low molecular weight protein arginine phosphatase [Kiritimatiellota bacterium]
MAEGLLRAALPKGTIWRVTSAGTSTLDGFGASAHAIDVMAEKGISIKAHRSQSATRDRVSLSDVIIAMTAEHARTLTSRFPECRDRIHLMRAFDPGSPPGSDVSDPFGGTLAEYRACCALLHKSMPGLLAFLEAHGGRAEGMGRAPREPSP